MAVIETLTDSTPRYYADKNLAFEYHYTNGGYLWRRKEGQSESYKQYATGVLQKSRMDVYDLFMVDGRMPTEETTAQALADVETAHADMAWFHEPL